MRRKTMLATLGTTLAATLGASAVPASAAVGSAAIHGATATLDLDGADDNVTVSVSGGLLVHGQTTGGLNSGADWDSATPGDQTVPADGTFTVVVNGGGGNDAITVLAKASEISAAKLLGDGGDDVLTGADTNDSLGGGEGNDRLVGAKGGDDLRGGAGNDTLVWNNGDASDVIDGEAGNDTTEVNGSPTLGDTFTLEPNGGRVAFRRTNLVPFTLDASTERFEVNGLGGNDTVSASDGIGALTLLSADGGAGADTVSGSDGPDLLLGGEGDDLLNGRGGDDRIVGDRGTDTMKGGAGDDALVWNNGDGTDVMDGDDGTDDVEVNGAPTAGDVFAVHADGARVRFDRTNLVPFSLDIGSSETLHVNGLGGDDAVTLGDGGALAVTVAGGAGSDTMTGGDSAETLLGGSGNDTIAAGGGSDTVDGGDGDDRVDVRDRTADLAHGGAGTDSVVADAGQLDVLDGFEAIDRTPNVTPPPVSHRPRPVTIGRGTLTARRGVVLVRLSRPAGDPGRGSGTLRLRTARAVRVAGRRTVLPVGRARFDVRPGTTRSVPVHLRRSVRSLVDHRGHVKVVAIASTDDGGTSSRHLTLALGTGARGH